MANENPGFAVNGNSSLIALSNDGLRQPVTLWADPLTHALITSGGGGSSGGTSSTFGATFPLTGTAIGVQNGANMVSLTEGQATMANSLPVTIASNQTSIPVTVGASSNIIGKVSIDQTTPGTTNRIDIADSLDNPISAFPATFLRTTDEPHQIFYDPFDSTLDVTNRWTSTQGSSGVAASNTAGVMSLGTGTVANGYSKLTSQPSFTLPIPAWLGISDAITIPDLAAPTANAYRFWGIGTTPGTPTATAPITDGVGFELSTAGKMFAVVYAGGTRTAIQDLSTSGNSKQPTDANQHRYIVYIRTDKAYWYIDGITSAQLVATSNFQAPQVQTLPKLFLAVGGSTPPASNSQIMSNGATAWDTGKNAVQIADGTFPWRKATVNNSGAMGFVNSELADVTGTITNATSTTPIVASGLTGYDNVLISINGTYTGATATFQGSDDGGTTWYNITVATRTDSAVIEGGYTLLSSITRAWNINVQGFDTIRVNPSALATGTANIRISPESAPTNAGATTQTLLTDGTNSVNILSGTTGLATGQNAQLIAGAYRELTGLSAASLNADLVPSTDISNTPYVALSILASAYSGTLTFQGSNDNFTTTHQVVLTRLDSSTSGSSGSTSASSLAFGGFVAYRYLRVRMTAYASGTAQGVLELRTTGSVFGTLANQAGTWTVGSNSATGSAFPANAFYVGASDGTNLVGIRTVNAGSDGINSVAGMLANTNYALTFNGTTWDRQRSATAVSNTTGTGLLGVGELNFDGTNYQRKITNTTGVVIAAGATSTNAGVTITTYNANKAVILVNIATATAATLTVTISGVTSSGYTYPILTTTALATVALTPLRIFPGATPTANSVANDMVPVSLKISTVVTGTITYGIDYELGV